MPSPFADELIAIKRERCMPGLHHFYQHPPVIVRGDMQYLYDAHGRRYLDCFSGVGVVSAGHCNPAITEAICRQVQQLQHTCTIYLTEPMFSLAEKLAALTEGNLPRAFFCNSGSEANDGAIVMARLATGRRKIMALTGSLHGRTYATMGVTGLTMWRTDPEPFDDVIRVPGYESEDGIETIEQMLHRNGELPAAIVVEPIQGNGGVRVAPDGWFNRLRALCDQYGVLIIADEVQTGISRTGKKVAMNHWDIWPDIMVLAKGLGNGQPIAAIMTRDSVAAKQTRPSASTFGGNPVSCAAALATLAYHEEHNLADRAQRLGAYLQDQLKSLAQKHSMIHDVRGKGLMVGCELKPDDESDAAQMTDRILESMKDSGYLIGKTGPERNVLTFMPPLIIEKDDIDNLKQAIDQVLLTEMTK